MTIGAFVERFGGSCDSFNFKTIAGHVFDKLGHIPKVGASVCLWEYQLEVEAMDHVRIAHLRVERIKKVFADVQDSRRSTRGDR